MSDALHAAIAEQAYFLWLDDGMAHGRAHEHWTLAEKLVTAAAPQAIAQAVARPTPRKASKAKASTKPLAKSATRAARIRFSETVLHA